VPDVNRVDKGRLRESFSARASGYAGAAPLQREVAERAAAAALQAVPFPRSVLDVGCGPGALLAALEAARPGAAVAGVDLAPGMVREAAGRVPRARLAVGDAEALPFAGASFDLVLSTSTFQWLPRLDAALAEIRRVLSPGGTFVLALFGEETLVELRTSWASSAPAAAAGTHSFPSAQEVGAALRASGLAVRSLGAERRVEWHDSPRDLLRSLREIGAGNAVPGRAGGLGLRRAVLGMERAYVERHGRDGRVPATWEIVTATAYRP
jgi:malonyl-CoA O-methyltransferase